MYAEKEVDLRRNIKLWMLGLYVLDYLLLGLPNRGCCVCIGFDLGTYMAVVILIILCELDVYDFFCVFNFFVLNRAYYLIANVYLLH